MDKAKEKIKEHLAINVSEYALISNPLLNKGMAFSMTERETFNLIGLLPPHEATLEEQCARSYEAFSSKSTDLEKYVYLRGLQDSNETLFYKLACDYLEEIMPVIYTPTVGAGCRQFSHIYRRPRGLFIAYPYRKHLDKVFDHQRFDSVEAIVVSDGERILGLGDQGAGGMGIPIGKLSLYTACAGIHPASTLPILLDVGTNNKNLLKDPFYAGWLHERISGKEYDAFIEQFVTAIKKRFPYVLLQWEDFAQQNATRILEKYHNKLCTFNDDIQGTAAVVAGTLLAAVNLLKSSFKKQKIVVVGAGSAGCGISRLLLRLMVSEGLTEEEAKDHFYLIDREGLLTEGMPGLQSFQQPFLQPAGKVSKWRLEAPGRVQLMDVIRNIQPTLLIGVCGQPNVFTESVVREMALHVERPIIFPLSNPTSHSEGRPSDILKWTRQRAIIGTGSPFPATTKNKRPFKIDQVNNNYIFPGVGLGVIAVKAPRVTDNMFLAAARALAACSPAKQDPDANLLPPMKDLREVSFKIAFAVAKEAMNSQSVPFHSDDKLEQIIRSKMWSPRYLPYVKA